MKRFLVIAVLGLLWGGEPCSRCGLAALCLGECAYQRLVDAEHPREQAEAYLVLGHAWVRGGLAEGVPRLVYEAQKRLAPDDSLAWHGWLLLGQAYHKLGYRDSALFLSERVMEGAQAYPFLRGRAYLALAALHAQQEPLRALAYAAEALSYAQQSGHPLLKALTYNVYAYLIAAQGRLTEAVQALQTAKALLEAPAGEVHLLLEPPEEVYSAVVANLASLYAEQGKRKEARQLYEMAFRRAEQAADTVGLGHAVVGLAQLALSQKQPREALTLLERWAAMYPKLPYELRKAWLQGQAQAWVALGQLGLALAATERWAQEAESELHTSHSSRIAQLRVLSGLEQREAQLQTLANQQRRERLFYLLGALLAVFAIGGLLYAVWLARRRAREERTFRETIAQQAARIEEQAKTLERQNEELIRISEALTEALSMVQDSYAAAKRLQRAILPPLERLVPGSAVYYQPLQEVGGDFYTAVVDPFSTRFFLAMGDCTGHGISGAILSGVVAATLQNLFLQNPAQPPLTLLRRALQAIRLVLQSDASGDHLPVREGADVALLIADFKEKCLHVGLAGRPVWVAHPREGLTELSGGRRGLDSFTPPDYEFPQFTLPLPEEGTVYLFSDGVTDLLNAEGKKFGIQRLRALLEAERLSPPKKQLQALVAELEAWRGKAQPNDDLTLLILPLAGLWEYAHTRLQVKA